MTIIDTASFWNGRIAKKTKGLRMKPLVNLIVDKSVMSKFLLDTLEAKETLTPDACFCIGEAGDAWQQAASTVIKGYDLEKVDADGWLHFQPKPTKIVEFFEVTADVTPIPTEGICIVGKWGQTIDGVDNLQKARLGDFIARQRDDHTDQWVVAKSIWLRSYTEIWPG